MSELPDRRLLLVHAHPDDETINNGITMARYVSEGAHVTLITCTLGEQGEVLVPELAHLAADQTDQLGRHRIGELDAAMKELGVTDHRFLGEPGKYRDTGMIYDEFGNAAVPPQTRPDSFWQADLLAAAGDLVAVIREIRPQVLVTYDTYGGYGHPDHIQAHRVATYAAALAAAPSYREDLGEAGTSPRSTGPRWRSPACARACAGCGPPATPPPSRGWTRTARWDRSSRRTGSSTA
jgi:N-acetyl-1-D-myo-inositol-2-amino-2-deoxy-alpha-D-glucopyranoside deacetylase